MEFKEKDPEIVPIFIISYGLSANLVTIYILICFFLNWHNFIKIHYFAILSYLMFVILNVLVYVVFDREKVIISNNNINITQSKIYIYLFTSLILPLILIIIKVNYLGGF